MEKYHNVNEVSDCRQLNPIWRSMFLNYLVDQLTFHLVPTRVPSVLINSLNNLLVDYSLLKILGNSHTTRFSISLTNNSSSNRKFQYPLICCFDEVRKSGKKAIKASIFGSSSEFDSSYQEIGNEPSSISFPFEKSS